MNCNKISKQRQQLLECQLLQLKVKQLSTNLFTVDELKFGLCIDNIHYPDFPNEGIYTPWEGIFIDDIDSILDITDDSSFNNYMIDNNYSIEIARWRNKHYTDGLNLYIILEDNKYYLYKIPYSKYDIKPKKEKFIITYDNLYQILEVIQQLYDKEE